MKVLLWIEYDGTAFCGYQIQANGRTVQEEVERALAGLLKEPIRVRGSSRTDSGVHARRYPLTFHTGSTIPADRVHRGLNAHLPEDIRALASMAVPEDFDARRSAQGKTYTYRVLNRRAPSALHRNHAYHVMPPLDLSRMQAASQAFLGVKDFSPFESAGGVDPGKVKDMRSIEIRRSGDFVLLTFTASGFLYNMARILAGILIDAGLGQVTASDIEAMFLEKRRGRSKVAPARGLFLEQVHYGASLPDMFSPKEGKPWHNGV